MTVVVRAPGARQLTDRRPTRRRFLKGYSAGRQAYDRRRRAAAHDAQTRAYVELLRRDPCGFCGVERAHDQIAADHIIPLDGGGVDHWANMGAACRAHNASKGNRSLLRWMLDQATAADARKEG